MNKWDRMSGCKPVFICATSNSVYHRLNKLFDPHDELFTHIHVINESSLMVCMVLRLFDIMHVISSEFILKVIEKQ